MALFTPTVNGEVLSPLTEGDRTASPPDKVEMTLQRIPSLPSGTGQQLASLRNTAPAQAQQVDGEHTLPTQDSQTMLAPSPLREAFYIKTLSIARVVATSMLRSGDSTTPLFGM
ncbi:hypothetical protein V8E51_018646 [Hyaloscypha variabilis]